MTEHGLRSKRSGQANAFLRFLPVAGIPEPQTEYRFHPPRRWRFDYAWPAHKLALEVQGGVFIQGRHTRGPALLKEWEKLNQAAVDGWRIVFCQPSDLHRIIQTIKQALEYAP